MRKITWDQLHKAWWIIGVAACIAGVGWSARGKVYENQLREQVKTLENEVVPRKEHEARWQAEDKRFDAIDRQLREIHADVRRGR